VSTFVANSDGRVYLIEKLSANSRRLKDFLSLPLSHQKLLEDLGWRKKIDLVDEKIEANAAFLKQIVADPQIFDGEEDDEDHEGNVPSSSNISVVLSLTLKLKAEMRMRTKMKMKILSTVRDCMQ
jgi:hypothetical protein